MAVMVGGVWGQTYWKRTYGKGEAKAITATPDGNFIVAGNTSSFGIGNSDIYLLKINIGGDTLWTKTYGRTDYDHANAITPTPDGNFIVAGEIFSSGAGYDIFLLKIKPDGDTLWTKTYGGTNDDYAKAITPTPDGNFIVAGSTSSFDRGGVYLLKVTANGDALWTKTYGGAHYEQAAAITPTSDGNFIIAGACWNDSIANYNFYLLKITTNGDTLWTKTYIGTNRCLARAITPTPDGNFLVAGEIISSSNGSNDVCLLKINSNGNTLWSKTYGMQYQQNEQAAAVTPTSEGNFLIAGSTSRSFGMGKDDAYLLKINSSGDSLWTKTYGGSGRDAADAITPAQNGNFIVAGTLDSNVYVLFFIDDLYAYKNSLFTFKIPVSGDSLNHGYTPLKAPAGMTVSLGGTISWTPTADSSYMDHVEFLVSDDMGKKDTLIFNIFVNNKDHPTKAINTVTQSTNTSLNDLTVRQLSSKEVRFSLPVGTKSLGIYNVHGQLLENISIRGNQAAWLPKHAAGRYFAKAIWEKREAVKPFMLLK